MPSITTEMLVHTLTVLELRPSRLVGTGLAPKKSLRGEKKVAALDGGGKSSDKTMARTNRTTGLNLCLVVTRTAKTITVKALTPSRLAKLDMVNPKQLQRFARRFRRKVRQGGTRKHENDSVCGDHVAPKRTPPTREHRSDAHVIEN